MIRSFYKKKTTLGKARKAFKQSVKDGVYNDQTVIWYEMTERPGKFAVRICCENVDYVFALKRRFNMQLRDMSATVSEGEDITLRLLDGTNVNLVNATVLTSYSSIVAVYCKM